MGWIVAGIIAMVAVFLWLEWTGMLEGI